MPEQDKYTSIAVALKRQMNEIIDFAYSGISEGKRKLYKNFRIECFASDRNTLLGYCQKVDDITCRIRIFRTMSESQKTVLITTIHEVSHHIDFIDKNGFNHGKTFYDVHKKLLYAAFDLGILTVEDVINSDSSARNRHKLARMMSDYTPSPSASSARIKTQIHVYNAYNFRTQLKERGYTWNPLDAAWALSCDANDVDREMSHLQKIGVPAGDVRVHKGNGVVTRLRKVVTLHNVPFDANAVVKDLGYRFVKERGKPLWRKQIDGNDIDDFEIQALRKIGVRWEVSK